MSRVRGKEAQRLLEELVRARQEADAFRFLWLDREPDATFEILIPGREYDTRERWHVHAAWRQSSAVLRIEPTDGGSEGVYLLDALPAGIEQAFNADPYRREALAKCRRFYVDETARIAKSRRIAQQSPAKPIYGGHE